MKRLIARLIDIRPEERGMAFLMFFYFFAVITSYYIIKPVRNSLFLDQLGAHNLPWVYIGTAVVIGFVIALYGRLVDRVRKELLIPGSILFLLSNLLVFWWLFQLELRWLPAFFYIWVSIYSVLVVTQFWTTANRIYSPPQAKRIFGFIGSGGILGGIAGSIIARTLVNVVGTENLLLICAAVLVTILLAVLQINRSLTKASQEVPDEGAASPQEIEQTLMQEALPSTPAGAGESALRLIMDSRHLQLIALILGLTIIVSTLVDFQFNSIAEASYATKDEKTAFFGTFFAYQNLTSFLIQFFLTSMILRKAGIGVALMLLPVGLFLGSVGVVLQAALWSGVLVKLADGSLRYSLDNSTREIIYLPITMDIKYKVKPFIDMFVQRFSRGIGGLIILVSTSLFALSISHVAVLSLVVIAAWIVVATALRKEYLNSIRTLLKTGHVRPVERVVPTLDASTVDTVVEALQSSDHHVVSYALAMLETEAEKSLVPQLKPLLSHSDPEVRWASLKLLNVIGDASLVPEVQKLLTDSDYQVLSGALFYLCSFSGDDPQVQMRSYLENPDIGVRCAAVVCLTNHLPDWPREEVVQYFETLLATEGEERELVRTELAHCLAAVSPPSPYHNYLTELLQDESVNVRVAAIESAGRVAVRKFVPHLIQALYHRATRVASRRALIQYGRGIVGTLADHLGDETVDLALRESVARVLGHIPDQRAAVALLDNLGHDSPSLRYNVIKSLNKLSRRYPEVVLHPKPVREAVHREARHYYELLSVIADDAKESDAGASDDLLMQTLRGRLDHTLVRIFRLLELAYHPGDMYSAYHAVTQEDRALQANAYELLDNLLDAEMKKVILPIVDTVPMKQKVASGRRDYKIASKPLPEHMERLYEQPDAWMRLTVLYTIGQRRMRELRHLLNKAIRSHEPAVKETAEYSLAQLDVG